MKKGFLSFCFTFCIVFIACAQHSDVNKYRPQLIAFQDSLKILGKQIINNETEPERINANYAFAKMLVRALKMPHSFNFGFDSIKTISIQNSPDSRFRIFSWPVMYNDGSYRYYGAVQINNTDGRLLLHGLTDYTPFIKNPADTVTTNDKWYGAQYYKIIPVAYNVKIPYYILLGWKGNTVKSNKKVIEVLYFKDGKPYFGMPVFDGDANNAKSKRIIFEYARQASMVLNYQPKEGMVVFDHIAAPDPKMKGRLETYGPDFTYDGFKLINGRWKLISDLPLSNQPTKTDDDFNDPRKPKLIEPRKL